MYKPLTNLINFGVIDSCQPHMEISISSVVFKTFFQDLKHFCISLPSDFCSFQTKIEETGATYVGVKK